MVWKSRACGLTELIRKIWMIAWDMWEHRNAILHESMNIQTETQTATDAMVIRGLYSKATMLLQATKDSYLIAPTLDDLLKRSTAYKKAWIQNALVATLVHRRRSKRARRELANMQRTMGRWLNRNC
jgi:hypothetical protein